MNLRIKAYDAGTVYSLVDQWTYPKLEFKQHFQQEQVWKDTPQDMILDKFRRGCIVNSRLQIKDKSGSGWTTGQDIVNSTLQIKLVHSTRKRLENPEFLYKVRQICGSH